MPKSSPFLVLGFLAAVALADDSFIVGTNLGGWMVLEPWITPSLFYRFLGKGQNQTALDSYTFCQALGPT